jgi:predicted nucleotidyltransferase
MVGLDEREESRSRSWASRSEASMGVNRSVRFSRWKPVRTAAVRSDVEVGDSIRTEKIAAIVWPLPRSQSTQAGVDLGTGEGAMTLQPPSSRVHLPLDSLTTFCRKWRVQELALFGSVLREDFSPESDVDVLVTFDPEAPWSLWDVIIMRGELEQILGRKEDLLEKDAIRNPFRRREILRTHQVVHAA